VRRLSLRGTVLVLPERADFEDGQGARPADADADDLERATATDFVFPILLIRHVKRPHSAWDAAGGDPRRLPPRNFVFDLEWQETDQSDRIIRSGCA
jgi:hypothetical protein